MEEIFRDIEGYEGLYHISDRGNVKSFKFGKEKILNTRKNKDGYLCVSMYLEGNPKYYSVHRLVCKAFLENPENKETVNHKNGIKTDNRLENLEWNTQGENIRHAFDSGLNVGAMLGKFGKDHHSSKPICRYTKSGGYIDDFEGSMDAARKTGISQSNINSCCKGKYKTSGGYIWKYKD